MTIQALYPDISPSLSLDFANVKQLDPRVTFARASTARYYDGKTVAKAEENLFTSSQDLNSLTTAWISTAITFVSNFGAAPDGTSTSTKLNEGTLLNVHIDGQPTSLIANTNYMLSVFVKNIDANFIGLTVYGGASNYASAEFDLTTGALNRSNAVGTGWTVNSTSITDVGGGWYRCVLNLTAGTTVSAPTSQFYMSDGTTAFESRGRVSYTGTNRELELWGAQLEQRSTVTAYTATTTQPITNYIPVLLTAANNEARFDHNPTTSESLGLLIEEQRTNLVVRSEEFDNASWTKTRSSIPANTVVAPNGTLTSDAFIPTTDFGSHIIGSASIAFGASLPVCGSVYFKAGGYSRLRLRLGQSSGFLTDVVADANTGTLITGSTANATITPVGNGWFRFSIFGTTGAGNTAVTFQLWVYDNSAGVGQAEFSGDGYSGIYIWGAQLEAGAFPTSYIPTEASQVTRSADAASMTGTNFSSWYRADEGTLYGDVQAANAAGVFYYAVASSGTGNEIRLGTQSNGGNPNFAVTVNSAVQASIVRTFAAGLRHKIAGSYRTNNFEAAVNGTSGTSGTNGILPTPDRLDIGQRSNGGNVINSHIRKLSFYPKALTAAELQALTT